MDGNANLIADTTQRIFRELGHPRSVKNVQPQRLWQALEAAGLTHAWVAESLNGSGAALADGFAVLRIAGEYAVSNPLAETLLGGWLAMQANLAIPDGPTTIAPVDVRDRITLDANGRISGTARAVPFAEQATQLVVLAMRDTQPFLAIIDRRECTIRQHANVAGDPRDWISFAALKPLALAPSPIEMDALMLMGAAVRSIQMAGALQGILDLSVAYANERVAFEKPIGKFQSVQHALARLAGETAAAIAAAGSAADAISSAAKFDDAVFLEIASAKIRVGEAITSGAAIAHQVHGAIGFSQEHVLHRYTQRLWAWRDDFGSESDWAARLGTLVARNGADALWPMLAAR